MKNLTKKITLTVAILSFVPATFAQQFAPQKVLDDLTTEQVQKINGLGGIPNKDVTSPVYDYHLSKILTPAQAQKYNEFKDGPRQKNNVNYHFNLDSK